MHRWIAAFAVVAILAPGAVLAKVRHRPVETPAPVSASPKPVEMVQLAPGPGVSIQIPKVWIACDADTAKLLDPEHDPLHLKDKVCGMSPDVPYKLRAFDPRPFHNLSMTLAWHEKQDMTPEVLAAMTPEILQSARSVICDAGTKPLLATGAKVISCDVSIVSFANHQAMLGTIVHSIPNMAVSNAVIDSWEFPYAQGYIQIQFSRANILRQIVQPEMDAIIASLQAQ